MVVTIMATNIDNGMGAKLDLIAKLLYMQVRLQTKSIKDELVTTEKQERLYSTLNGKSNIKELAKLKKLSEIYLEQTLPDWEEKGSFSVSEKEEASDMLTWKI